MFMKLRFKLYCNLIWLQYDLKLNKNYTGWGSYKNASCPYVRNYYEYIMVWYKNSKKKLNKGISTISKDDFLKGIRSVWTFPSGRKKLHPTSFPEELPRRCIEFFSYKNDVVLDPFLGSGTTAVVAKKLGRKYIGFEKIKRFYNISKRRLKEVK